MHALRLAFSKLFMHIFTAVQLGDCTCVGQKLSKQIILRTVLCMKGAFDWHMLLANGERLPPQ